METTILISGRVAKRISKELGTHGFVDSEQAQEISDLDDMRNFRIKVYHKAFAEQVEDILRTKLNWVKKD